MTRIHGDFGDLSRYSVEQRAGTPADLVLVCRDCDRAVDEWHEEIVPLDELTRAASEHEISEERDDGIPDDTIPLDRIDEGD
jgi:hypothetical protein